MRKNRITYALIVSSAFILAAPACQKTIILAEDGGKTPLEFAVALKSSINELPQTKAYDKTFESNDELYTYLQHVGPNGYVGFGRLCEIDVKTTSIGPLDNWSGANKQLVASDLYWDDFMNKDNDIRSSGHGLQSKYAYCFNGGTPSPALESDDQKVAGEIGWSVATDQSTAAGFKNSDLLMSGTQEMVAYTHSYSSALTGQHGVITLPFTHAMSKITVEIVAGNTFSGTIFDNTIVTLKNVATKCTVSAPTQTLSGYTTKGDVKMLRASTGTAKKRSFSAVIAPTVIKGGADAENAIELATLENVGGYNYSLKLTNSALVTAPQGKVAWVSKLAAYNANSVTPSTTNAYDQTNGGLTLPGVNYLITVTVERTGVDVRTEIVDWETVSATEVGQIQFEQDINTTGEITEELKEGGFDVYARSTDQQSYGDYASRVTWSGSDWSYAPQLYWPSGTYSSYFRALAPAGATTSLQTDGQQDVLWGITAKEPGYYESEGMAIRPRTGKVPLAFYHAMAKITFNLYDKNRYDPDFPYGFGTGHGHGHGHGQDIYSPYIDVKGAKISLHWLSKDGTMDIHTGNTTPGEKVEVMVEGLYAANDESVPDSENRLKDYLVVPQSMLAQGEEPYAIITLADGTKYRMHLRNASYIDKEGNTQNFNEWKMGTEYIYNIYMSKEQNTFSALIKPWDRKEGSGIADLEWD